MKIKKGLNVLEVSLGSNKIYPVLIYDKENVILVDTGYPGNFDAIKEQIEKIVKFEKLTKVILSHQDVDHMGGLYRLKEQLKDVLVLCHEAEKNYIEGHKTPIKFNPQMTERLKNIVDLDHYFVPVDQTLTDHEWLDDCGGIEIIHTPGHTPGHICLYLEKYKVLISGDALNVRDGILVGPNPQFTMDLDIAYHSLIKLTNLDISMVISYHGGVYKKEVNHTLLQLIKDYKEGKHG